MKDKKIKQRPKSPVPSPFPKDPTEDPRPISLLSYWIAHRYFEDGKEFDYSLFMTMVHELKTIDRLYRIVDQDEMSHQAIQFLLDRAYTSVKQYPVCPIVPFRNLAQTKSQSESEWLYHVRSKTKRILKKFEDTYLPQGVELQPRHYYGKFSYLNDQLRALKPSPENLAKLQEPRRFGIYYRVSTNDQETDSQKVEVEKYIEELPPDEKPSLVRVYEDKGISGSKDNRPEFLHLIEDAKSGVIDTVIVYRLDRLSRSSSTAIRLLLDFEDQGVKFISITQPILSSGKESPFRKTILAAFSELAQIEREAIVMRVKAGLQAARKRGVILGRAATYTPEQREKVLKLRAEGKKIREIAAEMNVGISWVKSVVAKAKADLKKEH